MNIETTIKLNDDHDIPVLGLGTYKLLGKSAKEAILLALEVGYRHIDTAAYYGNEEEVGMAVSESGVPREEIFITTKLQNDEQNMPREAFEGSLRRLGLDYVDLYLIHWPKPDTRKSAWQELQEIKEEGLARSIGVSNYTIKHLEEMQEYSSVTPAVDQVELSPFLPQNELVEYASRKNIAIVAYSPIAKARKLNDQTLGEIAKAHGKTVPQVMLRWEIQNGFIVIPKAEKPEHIKENADIFDFELSPDDMKKIADLNENYRTSWDPTEID